MIAHFDSVAGRTCHKYGTRDSRKLAMKTIFTVTGTSTMHCAAVVPCKSHPATAV